MFPPPCNQYVAWGYGDLSLRIGQLDGDKVSEDVCFSVRSECTGVLRLALFLISIKYMCFPLNKSCFYFQIIAVMEDFQVGQILCAACPDSRTLITGGKNTVRILIKCLYFLFFLYNCAL